MLPGCPTGRDKSHFSDRVHLKAGLQIATFSYPSSLSSFKPISYNLSLHGSSSATSYQRRNKKTGSRNGNTAAMTIISRFRYHIMAHPAAGAMGKTTLKHKL